MDLDDIHKVIKSLAMVNGHPDPEGYADKVIATFETGEVPKDPEPEQPAEEQPVS